MSWLQIKIWIERSIHWETSTLKNIDNFGMAKVQSALRPLSEHIFIFTKLHLLAAPHCTQAYRISQSVMSRAYPNPMTGSGHVLLLIFSLGLLLSRKAAVL